MNAAQTLATPAHVDPAPVPPVKVTGIAHGLSQLGLRWSVA